MREALVDIGSKQYEACGAQDAALGHSGSDGVLLGPPPPCENVYEFLHELYALHIFVVCTRQVHVRHDPISRNFLRKFISRSLQVSCPKLRKFVRSFSLRDVERKFVHIFVLQNLSIVQRLCPELAPALINTYWSPAQLYVGGEVIMSSEGTTQGDPLAMPLYAETPRLRPRPLGNP